MCYTVLRGMYQCDIVHTTGLNVLYLVVFVNFYEIQYLDVNLHADYSQSVYPSIRLSIYLSVYLFFIYS